MSLRTRLLLVLGVLTISGLLAADIATYVSLKSFLIQRVDRTVTASSSVLAQTIIRRGGFDLTDLAQLAKSNPGVYIGLINNGAVSWSPIGVRQGEKPPPPPHLNTNFTKIPSSPHTIGAQTGSSQFRASVARLNDSQQLVVAAPLNEVNATLRRLVVIEVVASLFVIGALIGLGLWLVRISFRPLRKIEETAGAIAEGDLTRRIPQVSEKTEVGRLGLALNAMLAQIEHAFAERTESEKRLRRFVGDASHELRTPLASVKAYAELFERGARDNPEDLARVLAGIERESNRMGILIDDLLLLARLDQGRPLEKTDVDLKDVVEDAVEVAKTIEPDRTVETVIKANPVVAGDRERLRQTVDNLLANVRVHTPSSTSATITLGQEDSQAFLEVADNGPGLTAEELPHIFERFYRADSARSRCKEGGTGLGLAIVSAIADAHGGRAEAENRPNGGLVLRVLLPIAKNSPKPDEDQLTT